MAPPKYKPRALFGMVGDFWGLLRLYGVDLFGESACWGGHGNPHTPKMSIRSLDELTLLSLGGCGVFMKVTLLSRCQWLNSFITFTNYTRNQATNGFLEPRSKAIDVSSEH